MNNTVYEAVNPTVVSLGYEIVDIVERSEYGQKVITFVVDKVPDGVSLDDCERLHYAIEPIMDELDPTAASHTFWKYRRPGWTGRLKRSAISSATTARKSRSGFTRRLKA